MALSVTVAKIWPSVAPTNEDYTIRLDVVLLDNAVQVKQDTFSITVNKNDVLTETGQTIGRFVDDINKWVTIYKKEKAAFNHNAYETIRAGVSSGISL